MSEKQMRLGALEAGGTRWSVPWCPATARSSTVWNPDAYARRDRPADDRVVHRP